MASQKYDIQKFDGDIDFKVWQAKVRKVLVVQGLAEALSEKPEAMKEEEWRKFDEEACSTIRSYLSREIDHNIKATERSAKEIWKTLEKFYNLKKQFFRLTMDEATSIQDHLNEFSKIIGELSNLDVKISAEDKVLVLLSSLPKKYSQWVTIMLRGTRTVVLHEITSVLLFNESYWCDNPGRANYLVIPNYLDIYR